MSKGSHIIGASREYLQLSQILCWLSELNFMTDRTCAWRLSVDQAVANEVTVREGYTSSLWGPRT